jgi:hypothetical protein
VELRLLHPYFHPYNSADGFGSQHIVMEHRPDQRTRPEIGEHQFEIYDLFEGTEQIQQLVISRAISGVHIR